MTTNASIERQVRRLVRVWAPRLGLYDWSIKFVFVDAIHIDDVRIIADATADWQYLQGHLRFYMPTVRAHPDELECAVIHELLHFVLDEIGNDDMHEERVTTVLEKAFMRAYDVD